MINIEELINTLIALNDNFQKFFTLFYIVIQYISKSSNMEYIKEIKNFYIKQALNNNNNLYDISNKSILLSVTQMNNSNLIQFISEYLESIFNDDENNIGFSQDIQKIIIIYIQNEKNDNLRQNIIKNTIKYLNVNKEAMEIKDSCKFILGIIKINNNDNNLINDEEIKNLLNDEFKKELNEMIGINENKNTIEEKKNNENQKEEKNEDEGEDEDFDEVEG